MNLPNLLTIARLVLSGVIFLLLGIAARRPAVPTLMLDGAFVLFVITALTDMFDGMIARRYGLVTTFGRIADPFADKVLVTGSFVFLLGFPQARLEAWMVVVIVSREFLVSGLRGYIEGRGREFSAMMWGKTKVTAQYTLIGWLIFYIAHMSDAAWAQYLTLAGVLGVTAWTALSGVAYLVKATGVLRNGTDG